MKLLRTLLIFAVTFAVLATAFYFVWKSQTGIAAVNVHPVAIIVTTRPVSVGSETSQGGVGAGDSAWVKDYENGRLVSQFRGTEYTPQKDGSFYVTNPVSIHYQDNGQYIVITGDNGVVYTDTAGPGASGNGFPGMPDAPRSGWLHHVRVAIFPSHTAMQPNLTMETDNIHFDNDTLRMYTESFVNDRGVTVPADMVPVKVRGIDYDFDGKGLTVRWNSRDKRLERLEVSHGDNLVIKHPSSASMPGNGQDQNQSKPVSEVPPGPGVVARNPGLRSTSDTGLRGLHPRLVANTTVAPVMKSAPPYQAVFSDDVHISQGPRQVAVADTMIADFFMQGADGATDAAPPKAWVKSAEVPVVIPPIANDDSDQPPPAVQQMVQKPGGLVATNSPTTAPSVTQPSTEPVTIRWTGRLLITALQTPPMMPMLAKQSVVRLVGSPVVLTPEGGEARAASVTYRSPDQALDMESSAAVPWITMKQIPKTPGQGIFLKTRNSLVFDPQTALATLTGPSELTMPLEHQDPMTVKWDKFGILHTVKLHGSSQISGVDHIDLSDHVKVHHPQFMLGCTDLKIALDVISAAGSTSGQSKEQPRVMTATGNALHQVDCRINTPGKPVQGITSDSLVIAMEQTAENKTFPREVVADGNVLALDPDQHMNSDHLVVYLLPKAIDTDAASATATRPTTRASDTDMAAAVELESLHATSRVHVLTKDKSTADCDDLRVSSVGTGHVVEMSGDNGATLTDVKGSRLIGSVVHLAPERNVLTVDGAGTLHTVQTSAATTQPVTPKTKPATKPAPGRPIDIAWTDSMAVDGVKNIADIVGHVIVKSTDVAGEISTMIGDKAHVDFMDAPKPTTAQAATRKATTAPADPMANATGNKQLTRLTLTGNVHGESALKDLHGALVRQEILDSNKLVYTAADGKATVPGPGKMFVENHRPDDPNTSPGNNGAGNNLGAMAVKWKKQLIYDPAALKIFIDGDTRVGFEKQAEKTNPKSKSKTKPAQPEPPMQLDSQHLIISLKKVENPATQPVKAGAAQPDTGKMKLSHLHAMGLCHFSGKTVDLDCDTIDYDPDTQILIARGDPGTTNNSTGTAIGTFSELVYNVATEEVVSANNVHGVMRK
jgi:hypothetical protein